MDILCAIGNTTLVPLRKVVPPGAATVLAKLEWENPTGSMKDRMAQAVISRADRRGPTRSKAWASAARHRSGNRPWWTRS